MREVREHKCGPLYRKIIRGGLNVRACIKGLLLKRVLKYIDQNIENISHKSL